MTVSSWEIEAQIGMSGTVLSCLSLGSQFTGKVVGLNGIIIGVISSNKSLKRIHFWAPYHDRHTSISFKIWHPSVEATKLLIVKSGDIPQAAQTMALHWG